MRLESFENCNNASSLERVGGSGCRWLGGERLMQSRLLVARQLALASRAQDLADRPLQVLPVAVR